ncbi:hypothetical protein BGZ68_003246 [Mortierella alpina]|nr:hypothetical protein BGZ68_003246 [Mortierella alpina]
MSSTPPSTVAGATSPVLSPTNGGIKKPRLRVQIPSETKENNTLAGAMIKEEGSTELPPIQKRPLESAPISSTLPSQFAKNLPSPSTFYPEFYASQAELSPIVFGQTPTSAQPSSAFNWPVPRERELCNHFWRRIVVLLLFDCYTLLDKHCWCRDDDIRVRVCGEERTRIELACRLDARSSCCLYVFAIFIIIIQRAVAECWWGDAIEVFVGRGCN